MTKTDRFKITLLLGQHGIRPQYPIFADRDYLLPDKRWLLGDAADAWRDVKERLGVAAYKAGSNDCDNFTRLWVAWMQILHHRTLGAETGTALAVGEFWYQSETLGGPHDTGVFIYAEDGDLKVGFFEPQTEKQIFLSRDEQTTCYVHYF